MRIIYFLILVIVLVAVIIFAVQNNDTVILRYLDRSITSSLPVLIAAVYLLGMLSGWTVVGVLRRSLRRVTKRQP